MTALPAPRHRAAAALLAVLGVLAVLLVPTGAQAAAAAPGGTSRDSAVPLPLADLDGSFLASNAHVWSTAGEDPVWNNVTWYSYTPPADVRVYVRATSVDGWDNTLEVWTAAGEFVTENDDAYDLDAALTAELQGGVAYTVGLGGFDAESRGDATVTFATRVPGAPTGLTVTPGDTTAELSWTAPVDQAGGLVAYTILCTPAGGEEEECATMDGTPPETSTTLSGLTNGTSYSVLVTASNLLGPSEPSAPVTFVPQAPSVVTVETGPGTPSSLVSGAEVDVVVTASSHDAPLDGDVDVTVAGTTTTLPLVDGQAVLADVVLHAGEVELAAAFAGSATVAAGAAHTTLTVAKRTQTLTFPALPEGLTYGGTPVALAATTTSGLPVTFTAEGACTVADGGLHLDGVGACDVTATQAGDSETEPASAAQSVDVAKRGQTVTLPELPALVYGDAPVALGATSSVGLPVTVTAAGACTVVDGALAVVGAGPCTVTAAQAGDEHTRAAESQVREVVVAKRAHTVSLSDLPSLVFGVLPTPVHGTSEFGLPVTLDADGACRLVDGLLAVVGAGDCTVTATSEGDEVTEAATATITVPVAGVPSTLDVSVARGLGLKAAGSPVSARGTGLVPGSVLTLEVHSTPRRIGTAVVGADGSAVVGGELPADLEPGAHHLVAVGTALDGSEARFSLPLTVSADGELVRIGDAATLVRQPPAVTPTGAVATVTPVAAGATGTLPRTGAEAGVLLATAAAWVVGGAALVGLRRRLSAR